MNLDNLDLAPADRALETHQIAFARLQQGTRQRRDPTDPVARKIRLIDTDDLVGIFLALGIADRHRRTEENLITTALPGRIDHLGKIESFGQEADAPINLAQTFLAIKIVAVFRPVTV